MVESTGCPSHEIQDNAFQKSCEESFSRKRESQSGGRESGRQRSIEWIEWRIRRRRSSGDGSSSSRRVHDRYGAGPRRSQRQLWRKR